VFSNVYLKHLWITKSEDIIDCVRSFCFVAVTGVWKNNNNVKCLQSTIDVPRKDYDRRKVVTVAQTARCQTVEIKLEMLILS
jgi:hypothetical protein